MKRALFALFVTLSLERMQPLLAAESSSSAETNAPRQVLIEAVILEVALNDSSESERDTLQPREGGHHPSAIGVLANAHPVFWAPFSCGTANAANGRTTGFGYMAGLKDDLDSMVAALSRERRVKILQRPRIQTSDAVPATLFIGEQRSYPGFYRGSDRYAPIQELQTGLTLNVIPSLKPDGVVQMDLRLRIDQFEGNVTIQNVGSLPVTSSREAQARVAVRARDTVLLGGLSGAHHQKDMYSLPFPKDLPVPVALSSPRVRRSELMVLVRPTLLPD